MINAPLKDNKRGYVNKKRTTVGDTTVKTKDIALYNAEGLTYLNAGRRNFIPQVASGKINMYKYERIDVNYDQDFNKFRNSKKVDYFIQKGSYLSPAYLLRYKSLKGMIEPNTPEFEMFGRYEKARRFNRGMGYTMLGMVVGGAVLAFSTQNETLMGVGAASFATGTLAYFPWLFLKGANARRLLKTVLIADDIDPDADNLRPNLGKLKPQ